MKQAVGMRQQAIVREKTMTKKIILGLLTAALLTTATVTTAQQPKKVPRIGYLIG